MCAKRATGSASAATLRTTVCAWRSLTLPPPPLFKDQGEQNIQYGRGSATSGYQCQQASLIKSWRALFSAAPNTTAPDFPFGVISLAGGAGEGSYLWSPYNHIPPAHWDACEGGHEKSSNFGDGSGSGRPSDFCSEINKDWAGGIRAAQTGGFGFTPNAALPNVFLGQNFDQGEPCNCDQNQLAPNGCWATEACFGTGPLSLNLTHNYQFSAIHPRVKHIVGERLARALIGLQLGKPQATPKFAGCRFAAGAQQVTLIFDAGILGAEAVFLQDRVPGSYIPLEFQIAPANGTTGTSGWVYASSLRLINGTSISALMPPNSGTPTAVRYAWGDYVCCPGMDEATFFCPPSSCPIVTSATKEPAVPFWAVLENGKCVCDAPWECTA